MRLDADQCRARARQARFAVLATRRPDGAVDLVPITFALVSSADGDVLLSAVDHKPKSTQRLARLANVRHDPSVTVLFDHRDDADWTALWWVRARGRAVEQPAGFGRTYLEERYPQYREVPPAGPVLQVIIDRWQGWSASDG